MTKKYTEDRETLAGKMSPCSKFKWSEIYESEEALIEDMLLTETDIEHKPWHKICRGYEYLNSFKRYFRKNGCLTPKQVTQLKRMAQVIFKHVNSDVYKLKDMNC